jgi:F0F1-type ATP synthase delta subunit
MAFENEKYKLLLTSSLQDKNELNNLMAMISENKSLDDMLEVLRESEENNRIIDSIKKGHGRIH